MDGTHEQDPMQTPHAQALRTEEARTQRNGAAPDRVAADRGVMVLPTV